MFYLNSKKKIQNFSVALAFNNEERHLNQENFKKQN